ncbi:Transcriptional regulator superfamily [Verrucomicrobiia bacterium DG1235]|nr:Transcriptional regulator superfamily [Verrucomicrobiae bacterium DG1235]
MLKYGKTSQNAIMALCYLAEGFDNGVTRHTSRDIATNRNLPQPIVAKLLVLLSQAGLVLGTPGPKGGYWLARDPQDITLYDIVSHFERDGERISCPKGIGKCDESNPCALHQKLIDLDHQLVDFLHENTLEAFVETVSS